MDIAIASVIASASVGIASVIASFYATRASRRQIRGERVAVRKADTYLEMLSIVEAEGIWVETKLESHIAECEHSSGDIRPDIATRPSPTEMSRARAIVLAYGSRSVQEAFGAWIVAVQDVESEYQNLSYLWAGRSGHIDAGDLRRLEADLVPKERGRRLVLGSKVSLELNQA